MKHLRFPNLLILIGNLIPVIGYFFMNWNLAAIFMFYMIELVAYELSMLPKIVLFVFYSDEYEGDSVFSKVLKSLLWIIFRLFQFVLSCLFFEQLIFGNTEITDKEALLLFMDFVLNNRWATVYIFAQYIFGFVFQMIIKKGYKNLTSRIYLPEISLFYIVLLAIIGVCNIILPFGMGNYQLVMLFAMFTFKTGAQIALRKRKDAKTMKFESF